MIKHRGFSSKTTDKKSVVNMSVMGNNNVVANNGYRTLQKNNAIKLDNNDS